MLDTVKYAKGMHATLLRLAFPELLKSDCEKSKAYAKRHPEKLKAYQRLRAKRLYDLKTKPCIDCGGSFPPECMDFHHVNGNKVKTVGQMVNFGMDRILEEVAKCELICANCHRIRHNELLPP